jgi:uncharacterized protein with PIN domain
MPGDAGFDRLRPRAPASISAVRPSDPEGRRALYSVAGQSPSLGAVTIECSLCKRTTVVTPRRLVGLAVPSLHLPLIKRHHPSWMRCPACGARTWVRVRLRF